MSRRSTPFEFTNIHGQPLGRVNEFGRTVKQAADQRRDADVAGSLTQADLERVFDALALTGWRRSKTALMTLLRAWSVKREDGRSFGSVETGGALLRLQAAGRVQAHDGEGWSVPDTLAEDRLAALLAAPRAGTMWRELLWVAGGALGPVERLPMYFTPRHEGESVALLRLLFMGGVDAKTYATLADGPLRYVNTSDAVLRTLNQLDRLGLSERIDIGLRWQLLASLDLRGKLDNEPALLAWVEAHIDGAPDIGSTGLRLRVAELRLQRGDGEGMESAIACDAAARPFMALMRSLLPAREGRFAATAAAFAPAWKALCAD